MAAEGNDKPFSTSMLLFNCFIDQLWKGGCFPMLEDYHCERKMACIATKMETNEQTSYMPWVWRQMHSLQMWLRTGSCLLTKDVQTDSYMSMRGVSRNNIPSATWWSDIHCYPCVLNWNLRGILNRLLFGLILLTALAMIVKAGYCISLLKPLWTRRETF